MNKELNDNQQLRKAGEMYRKPLCIRKIFVTVPEIYSKWYSGLGYISAIDTKPHVCVHFIGKGSVWFTRDKLTILKRNVDITTVNV